MFRVVTIVLILVFMYELRNGPVTNVINGHSLVDQTKSVMPWISKTVFRVLDFPPVKNDQIHREADLPAVIYADGTKEWWKNGERYYPKQ